MQSSFREITFDEPDFEFSWEGTIAFHYTLQWLADFSTARNAKQQSLQPWVINAVFTVLGDQSIYLSLTSKIAPQQTGFCCDHISQITLSKIRIVSCLTVRFSFPSFFWITFIEIKNTATHKKLIIIIETNWNTNSICLLKKKYIEIVWTI